MQDAVVSIRLNIVACPTYPEKFNAVAPFLLYFRLSSSHCTWLVAADRGKLVAMAG